MREPLPLGPTALKPDEIRAVSECLRTLRSVRRFQSDDVPAELIDFVLDHAVQAGSGKNRQPWRFVVVREPEVRGEVARWYRATLTRHTAHADLLDDSQSEESAAQIEAAQRLADHFTEAPVLIVPCFLPIPRNPADFFGGASIYPAIQNLLLSARAVGLGATLTTVHAVDGITYPPAGGTSSVDQLRHILGIPDSAVPAAVIPLGYPVRQSTSAGDRLPVRDVTYADAWGRPWRRDRKWWRAFRSGKAA
ncbi:nitroreductase family protein [Streptomyces sp. NPDC020681]|uniref:nitroreductase family protein n=1 Tax=Streptomyces sp. NPDC020681 TaxID=3365083 RepID=UPI00379F3AE0